MPKITIVRSDNTVIVDGERHTVDCSSLPPMFHALQWDGARGEVEYAHSVCIACGQNHKAPNRTITSLADVPEAAPLLDAWKAAKADAEAAAEAEAKAAAEAEAKGDAA